VSGHCSLNLSVEKFASRLNPTKLSVLGVQFMQRWGKPVLVLLLSLFILSLRSAGASGAQKSAPMPIIFETNRGQVAQNYRFVSRHSALEMLFSSDGVDLVVGDSKKQPPKITFRLLDSRQSVVPEARNPLRSVSNYLVGNNPSRWLHDVPNQAQVVYREIYPGIELLFHGDNGQLEHDFHVASGADPGTIRFSISGVDTVALDATGNLELSLPGSKFLLRRPVAYQESPQGEEIVQSAFVLDDDGSVGFRVGAYDRSRELVIDPVFVFSTYLAGNTADWATAITSDSTGNVYVTGYTNSLDFPIANGIQPTASGSPVAFVSKLDPTGHTLLYSTYLGGSSRNYGNSIAVDSSGNIIVAGVSSSNDFPHAGSVPTTMCSGNNDCFFLVSLKPDGSEFNYAGLIGGIEGTDAGFGPGAGAGTVAVDSSGNVYLASVTDDATFEITPGTLATSVPGYPFNSTFVMKVNPTGALVYSTIVPGTASQDITINLNNVFEPTGISVDATGEATIAGSAGPGLPSTTGVIQPLFPNPSSGNESAGFVLQLNATASAIKYATYVTGTDTIGGLAVDRAGNTYVTGGTSEPNLPVSTKAYQKTLKAGQDCTCNSGFIVKLNGLGTSVLAASYLEGTPSVGNEGTSFSGIALDSHANVFVGGMTGSSDFPMANPFVSEWVSGTSVWDMVIASMSSDLSSVQFGSFLSSTDQGFPGSAFAAIAMDSQNHLLVLGQTVTTDFPTTPDSFQPTPPSQAYHPFIAKLDMATPAPSVCLDSWGLDFGNIVANQSITRTLHVTNCGNASVSIASLVSSDPTVTAQQSCGSIAPKSVCSVSITYKPRDSSALQATLSLNDNAAITPQVVQLSGQGMAAKLSPSTGSFNFGDLLVNTTGALTQLFFYNAGTANLAITSAFANGDFAVNQNSCSGSIAPNFGCSITVTFSPTAAGIRTGTLTVNSNDPVYPQAALSLVGTGDSVYAVPIISSPGSGTAQINNGRITVDIQGANFYPASKVSVNGTPQTTTYLSGQQIQAALSSSVTNTIGEVFITVMNPAPGGGTSVPAPFTLYQAINLDVAFLAAVPGSPLLYASIPSSASSNPNTVVAINPTTGALGTPIRVGNNPGLLAASSDSSYLFVVANQDQTVQRINLSTKAVDQTFAFPTDNCSFCGTNSAVDLKGVPGSPQQVVLATTREVALYNGSGLVNYVPTTWSVTGSFTSFAFAGNPKAIYSLPITNAQTPFLNVIGMTPQGLQFTPPSSYGLFNQTGAEVASDGTLLYTSAGQVWSPTSQSQVGTFPVTNYNSTSSPNLYNLVVDSGSGNIFVLGEQNYQVSSSALVLSAYSKSLNLSGSLAFTQLQYPLDTNLVRWSSNGFAFLAPDLVAGMNTVYTLTSSLANSSTSNPVPQLSSISPTSTPEGTTGIQLTLNGQGFGGSSAVMWNGSPLTTTYVAGSVLTASVPAANLASSSSALVTVTNPAPGGGTSNAVSFAISPLAPVISFSVSTVGFSRQQIGTSSSAQTVSIQNPGTAPLNILGVSITGANSASFQQKNSCPTTLSPGANCAVSAVFAPVSSGAQSASLTFTDNAAGSPHSVSLTGTGVSLGLASASGGSTSATVSAGTTAGYSLVIGGAGIAGTATITCTGAPRGATCSVPGTVTLSATMPSSLTVTVTTGAQQAATASPMRFTWFWALALLGVVALPKRREGEKHLVVLKALPVLLLAVFCSCGGGGGGQSNQGTPAGKYSLNITATQGSSSQSLPLTLTVQ
jgi:hypothetical protein